MSIKSIFSHKLFPLLPITLGFIVVGFAVPQIVAPLFRQPAIVKTTPKPAPSIPKKPATPVVVTPPVAPPVKPTVVPTPPPPAPTPVVVTPPPSAPVVTPDPGSGVSGFTPTPPPPTGDPSPPPVTSGYTSTNWSGYFANSATFTTVAGSWTVPNPTGNGTSTSADATWIGIGGVSSSDLIQVGTLNAVSASGKVSSEAFYELLPAASQPILTITVTPGDVMSASISLAAPGQWTITITDVTTGQTYTGAVAYSSTQSSAEWIEEDPSNTDRSLVPFDNFGSATFSGGTTTANGSLVTITGGGAYAITMLGSNNQPIATPSALTSDGGGFTVTRN